MRRANLPRGPRKRSRSARVGSTRAAAPPNGHAVQHEIEQFLYRQAELLDAKRWQDYVDLFAEDGIYWMPARPEDTTWDGVPSIFAEDKNLMNVRRGRVQHPDAWSQRPLWGTNHVVGNVIVERIAANGDVVARSRFHMLELRRDNVRHFAGGYVHHLKKTQGRLPHQAPARGHDQRASGVRLRAPGLGVGRFCRERDAKR